ncbi:MAG TPA: PEP-CTERM sorting domain-containing protein, partial [Burkholderiales bacterium]|nr:PEP-CTERM sorting domain-containing protein [Burkholderiales bacterium]
TMAIATNKITQYSFLGLSGANNSNSFANWSAAALAIDGIHASNFGIYVFSLGTSNFSGNDYINLTTNLLPEGTFAVSYGVDSSGKAYSTAFTNAGMRDTPVPEPMTLALVGLGLVAIGFTTRRKFSRDTRKGKRNPR